MNRLRLQIAVLLCTCLMNVGCEQPNPNAVFPPIPKEKLTVQGKPGPVDKDAPEEFSTTESGLKYRIRRKSDGKKPTATDRVKVHYRGTLDNGDIFDSSYGRTGGAVEFGLNQVIPGWTEGMQLIGEGGMIELEIPPELGYGKAGEGNAIPPDSTLHFIVELLSVK